MKKIFSCNYILCGKKIILCAERIDVGKKKKARHQGHHGKMASGKGSAEAWIDREFTSSRSSPLKIA